MNILRRCADIVDSGKSCVMVTVMEIQGASPGKPGFKLLLTEDGDLTGTVGGGALEHRAVEEAREALETAKNRVLSYSLEDLGMTCGGKATLSVEYFPGGRGFVLFGGGHVGRALAPILDLLGFSLTVFDSREEVRPAVEEKLETARRHQVLIGDYTDISELNDVISRSRRCFIATHGHEHDLTVLRQLLELPCDYEYIGLIGSKNKIANTVRTLKSEGHEIPDSLHAPVGIRIGGDTPAEIAVGIAAEIIALTNNASVEHMRLDYDRIKKKP